MVVGVGPGPTATALSIVAIRFPAMRSQMQLSVAVCRRGPSGVCTVSSLAPG